MINNSVLLFLHANLIKHMMTATWSHGKCKPFISATIQGNTVTFISSTIQGTTVNEENLA